MLVPLTSLYRSAPLRAFAIRQLGGKSAKTCSVLTTRYTTGRLICSLSMTTLLYRRVLIFK